ncbi:hypothetical protein NDU88_003687 [Pleurodeles waltl]|uniref:Uncharacterized protein n=1 Tax=Pleurodeles waltl TaxID=8319 RepID=A0AAV7RFX5_PLEWA|nr:hypothetical protein NDU88_003687 [Pleurodeles waltl]
MSSRHSESRGWLKTSQRSTFLIKLDLPFFHTCSRIHYKYFWRRVVDRCTGPIFLVETKLEIQLILTAFLMSNGNGKIVICSFVREEDNVVLPRPRDSRLTFRARESELDTLGVERTVEGCSCDIAAVYVLNKIRLTIFPHL